MDESTDNSIPALARRYLRTLLGGWWSLAIALILSCRALVQTLTLLQILFLIGCLGMMATTLLFPWIVYDVTLLAPEVAGRGSNYRILFFLPGPLGILFYAIGGKYRLLVYYGLAVLIGLLYLAGVFFPNPIHTFMQNPGEYQFHPSIFVYGGSLALAVATAWQALRSSLISLDDIRAYLLEPRKPAEALNPDLNPAKKRK